MRAITVIPGQAGSARLDEVREPPPEEGAVLVDGLALGVCGTDLEIIRGEYGFAPEGAQRLVLGHESLGRVREAPAGLRVSAPATSSSASCAARTRCRAPAARAASGTSAATAATPSAGSRSSHGFGSERWRIEPEFAVRLDAGLEDVGVLLEPTSVVAKAWEQIERIGARACFDARRVLVTGAGPIGLLAALLAVQRGLRGPRARPRDRGPEAGARPATSAGPTTPARSATSARSTS